jgi:hypothetical protein
MWGPDAAEADWGPAVAAAKPPGGSLSVFVAATVTCPVDASKICAEMSLDVTVVIEARDHSELSRPSIPK